MLVDGCVLREAELGDEPPVLAGENPADDADDALSRQRIPARAGDGPEVGGHRTASEVWIGCAQSPASSAGNSSNSRPNTSATAPIAAGRTSSTERGRTSSRDI